MQAFIKLKPGYADCQIPIYRTPFVGADAYIGPYRVGISRTKYRNYTFIFLLAIFRNMVYTMLVIAGVMEW